MAICATVMVVAALLYLAVTGRLHPLFALAAAALPFARRLFSLLRFMPFLRQLKALYGARATGRTARSGNRSDIQTRFLAMVLDHDSGEMAGKILEGQFEGMTLAELNAKQLNDLLAECQVDTDSVNVLEAYLDRVDATWRESGRQHSGTDINNGTMNERQALQILGLETGASRDEIVVAHRHLMQKLHPDRGGSTYLAAKLNEAKDYLLG